MRRWWLVAALAACGSGSGGEESVCARAAEAGTCPACSGETFTCVYEEWSVTSTGCGGCETQLSLFDVLCDAGVEAPAAEVAAQITCEEVVCEVFYGCGCEPSCLVGSDVPVLTCDTTCSNPAPAPGPCEWRDADQSCAFR